MSIFREVETFLIRTETDRYPVKPRPRSTALTAKERALCSKIEFDPEDAAFLKELTGNTVELLEFGGDEESFPVGVYSVTSHDKARKIIREHQDKFRQSGKYLFLGERYCEGSQVAIAHQCTDPYRIMELACTNGDPYCTMTDDLVAKVREWNKRFGIRITGIGFNFCEAEIQDRNIDYRYLSEEVSGLCPDVLSIHATGMLEEEMRQTGTIRLCWDWNSVQVAERESLKERAVPAPVETVESYHPRIPLVQQLAMAISAIPHRLLDRVAASFVTH